MTWRGLWIIEIPLGRQSSFFWRRIAKALMVVDKPQVELEVLGVVCNICEVIDEIL